MGYVFSFKDALAYERWAKAPQNRAALELEFRLMRDLLDPRPGETVVDIGCGIGMSLGALLDMGLRVTGLDPSNYMLDIAVRKIGSRVDFYQDYAEDLPFDDNSFNYACLFTTLEFVEDPRKALEEAFRVAKDQVFIGVLNRYAIRGIQMRVHGMFNETFYNHARFFSVWEVKQVIRSLLGAVPITWRTACQIPTTSGGYVESLEQSKIAQRCPFGAFVGIVVTLVPRFRTRPLTMRYRPEQTPGTATG